MANISHFTDCDTDETILDSDAMAAEDDCFPTRRAVRCHCPRCGKKHFLTFSWAGNGTPRMYCYRCRETISKMGDLGFCEVSPEVSALGSGAGRLFD